MVYFRFPCNKSAVVCLTDVTARLLAMSLLELRIKRAEKSNNRIKRSWIMSTSTSRAPRWSVEAKIKTFFDAHRGIYSVPIVVHERVFLLNNNFKNCPPQLSTRIFNKWDFIRIRGFHPAFLYATPRISHKPTGTETSPMWPLAHFLNELGHVSRFARSLNKSQTFSSYLFSQQVNIGANTGLKVLERNAAVRQSYSVKNEALDTERIGLSRRTREEVRTQDGVNDKSAAVSFSSGRDAVNSHQSGINVFWEKPFHKRHLKQNFYFFFKVTTLTGESWVWKSHSVRMDTIN